MDRVKKGLSIVSLTILLAMVAYLSFFASCMPKVLDRDSISEVEKLLSEIKVYNFGQSRESLTALSGLVRATLESPDLIIQIEKEMIKFLKSDATFAGKQFICGQLSIIGTEEAVPALANMLSDEKTADIALYALERIPYPASGKALNEALSEAEGKVKIGIINSLGQRKDIKSVGTLEKLVYDTDPQIAQSAVVALGKIADNSAAIALEMAKSKTTGELRSRVLDAYLRCADNLFEQGNTTQAVSIYRELYNKEESVHIRAAALRGLVQTNKEGAIDIILAALKSDDQELQSAAIGLIRELPGTLDLKKIITECPNLSDQGQIQLLTAFADRSETSARQAALDATKHQGEAVRVAALKTLAKIGNESDIALLAHVAAESAGAEREAARESLYLLRGASVDQNIIAQIPDADSKIKVELVRSIVQRNVVDATRTLLKTAVEPDQAVRRESIGALAIIAAPEFIDELIQILIKEENNEIRKEAERSVVAVARKIQDKENQAEPVLNILPSVENREAKISLLQVLGKIGDKNALPVLRNTLKSEEADFQEAAIQALSVWHDAEPIHDLLNVVKTSNNETHKILALRGYIDLLRIESDRADKESINLYLAAMELATELSEKRMVLSGLAALRSMEALETTAQYLDDPTLQPEAEVSVVRLAANIRDADNKRVIEILNKILEITNNSSLRERAANILERIK